MNPQTKNPHGLGAGLRKLANATGTRRGRQSAGVRGVALARAAVQGAAALLSAYARDTDYPPAGVVEAADLLDVALSALDGAS